ncbi:MAG: polysaccharide deacetylase family protein [Bacteroidetes bacterium]|nr:MAG: polysaccharide deacetylase family protein [Bacteroidota bacterium]
MRLFRPCFISDWLYPDALFRIKTNEKILFLTFDDGPDPGSTPALLDILDKHNIKALFFCNGASAEKYPEMVNRIRTKGHLTGNHGYGHLNGWKTSGKNYIDDIIKAAPFTSNSLFRPPFGYLRLSQYRKLKRTFKIVFWDIMPYDFDNTFGRKKTLGILKKKIRSGSIIVLHDTINSSASAFIEEFIIFAKEGGFRFGTSFLSES